MSASVDNALSIEFTADELKQVTKFLTKLSVQKTHVRANGIAETEIPAHRPIRPPVVPIPKQSQNGVRSERSRLASADPHGPVVRPRSQSQPKTLSSRSRRVDRQRHSSSGGLNLAKAAKPKPVRSTEHYDLSPVLLGYYNFIKEGAPAERGVVNEGVLCYAIVLVQSLLGTNSFSRLAILDNVNWSECSPITANLISVLRLLWLNHDSSAVAVKNLVCKIAARNNVINFNDQQDVLEFLTLLLGEILSGNADAFNVHQTYARKCFKEICSGQLVYTSKCGNCDYGRIEREDFTSLSLPVPREKHNHFNIYAIVEYEVCVYGLRTHETALAKDIVNCLVTDSRISQQNSAVLAYDRDQVKVFEPHQPLDSTMDCPMYSVVQLTTNPVNLDVINAVVFIRDRSLRAPFVCSLKMRSSAFSIWRNITEVVFNSQTGAMPILGDLDIRIANTTGAFENFTFVGRSEMHPIQSRNCFWPENTARPFIVLTIDMRFVRKPFAVRTQKEIQHSSYFANMGPSIDKLLTKYFEKETVDFVCRQCNGTELKRSVHVERSPQVLFLHLNRFAQDENGTVKVNGKVSIPRDCLDLAPYFNAEHTMQNQKYYLNAVISHLGGTVSSGHYQCYRRNPVTGKWRIFSDSRVYAYNFPEHLTSTSAYFLVYEKMTTDSNPGKSHWFRNMHPEQLRRNISSTASIRA